MIEQLRDSSRSEKIEDGVNSVSQDEMFILFTSGSTGKPKGVVHSVNRYLIYTIWTMREFWGFRESSTMLCISDAGWINGHTYQLYGPLLLGGTTVLVENPVYILSETKLQQLIQDTNPSIAYFPVALLKLMRSIYKQKSIPTTSIELIGSMGEPLSPSIAKWAKSYFGLVKAT